MDVYRHLVDRRSRRLPRFVADRGAEDPAERKRVRTCHADSDLLRRAKLSYQEIPVTIRYTSYSQAKGQSMFNSFNIVIDLMLRKLFK